MNSFLRIRVQVIAKEAAKFAQIAKDIRAINLAAARSPLNKPGGFGKGSFTQAQTGLRGFMRELTDGRGFAAFTRNLQWTGRQIEYNFTQPIMRAATAAFGFFMKNDEAATKIIKVYGNVADSTSQLSHEFFTLGQTLAPVNKAMNASEQMSYDLGTALRYLSDIYGVSQGEVNALAASWASAGYQGTALAKAVEQNLQAMIIGDFTNSEEAFQSLIAITGAYGGQVDNLTLTMAKLNAVENDTAATFSDLTVAMSRSGATAFRAGVDVDHLAAMIAALVPAGATAETAGNALKTIFSRLLAPTQQAADALGEIGIAVDSSSWMELNAVGRLEKIAEVYKTLTPNQQAYVDAVLASRYQIDKFGRLIQAINNPLSDYNKALAATVDDTKVLAQYDKEMETVLKSNSKTWDILKTRIGNMLTEAIVPLIPSIIQVVSIFTQLLEKIGNMSPRWRTATVAALTFLALLGPVIRIGAAFGMVISMVAGIGKTIIFFGKMMIGLNRAIASSQLLVWATNPYVLLALAIAAAAAALYIFREDIADFFIAVARWTQPALEAIYNFGRGIVQIIVGAFKASVGAVLAAMRGIVNIIKNAALAAYEWLSYLNPFARHSPSLIEQVTKGVDIIAAKYASLARIGTVFRRAAADFAAFGKATEAAGANVAAGERAEQRGNILSVAPNAGPELDALYSSLDALNGELAAISYEMDNQQAVVNDLTAAYDKATAAWQEADNVLDTLKATANQLQNQYDAAKARLEEFASANIEGMGAAEQATFENEMAQKALQLQILKLKQSGAMTFEEIADRVAEMNGEITNLQGVMANLRQSGAGSEVLGPLEAQLAALKASKGALSTQGSPIAALEDQLKKLQEQAEIMDLENALKFDPMRRQIDLLSDSIEEMPFDQIVAGIIASRAEMDAIKPSLDAANDAMDRQQAVVDALAVQREKANAALDAEKAKLDELKGVYDAYEQQIRDIEDALNDYAAAANAAAGAGGGGGGGGLPSGDAAFEVPQFDPADSEQAISDYLDGLKERFKGFFDKLDIKKWFADRWKQFTDWFSGTAVGEWLAQAWGWLDRNLRGNFEKLLNNIPGWISTAWNAVLGFFTGVGEFLAGVGMQVAQPFIDGFNAIKDAALGLYNGIVFYVQAVLDFIFSVPGRIAGFATTMWDGIKNAFGEAKDWINERIDEVVGFVQSIPGRMSGFVSGIFDGIKNSITTIKDRVKEKIDEIIAFVKDIPRRIIEFSSTLFTSIWTAIINTKNDVGGTLDDIVTGVKNLPGKIRDAAVGMWNGIKDAFTDMLKGVARLWNNFHIPSFKIGGWELAFGVKMPTYTTPRIDFPDVQGLERGGVIQAGLGGMLARIGEANRDEAVVPLPHGWRNNEQLFGGGKDDEKGKTVNFYGDLSFPNITEGKDAEEFLANLEVLASR